MRAEVTIADSSKIVTFITIHMKAFSDIDSYNKRLAASGRLKNHIDFTTLEDEPVIILGDLNDEVTSSITFGQDSPYDNFLQDTEDYFFATLEMELDGRLSWCSNFQCTSGSTIDHILITNEMLPFLVASSPDHYDELLDAIPAYGSTTSDHLPVLARFDLNRASAVEDIVAALDPSFDVYPNPFKSRLSVRKTGLLDAQSTVSVYSITGRLVHKEQVGPKAEFTIDLGIQPSGVYMVQIRSDRTVMTQRIVKM